MDGLQYFPDDPYYRLGPVHKCLYVRACRLVTGTSSNLPFFCTQISNEVCWVSAFFPPATIRLSRSNSNFVASAANFFSAILPSQLDLLWWACLASRSICFGPRHPAFDKFREGSVRQILISKIGLSRRKSVGEFPMNSVCTASNSIFPLNLNGASLHPSCFEKFELNRLIPFFGQIGMSRSTQNFHPNCGSKWLFPQSDVRWQQHRVESAKTQCGNNHSGNNLLVPGPKWLFPQCVLGRLHPMLFPCDMRMEPARIQISGSNPNICGNSGWACTVRFFACRNSDCAVSTIIFIEPHQSNLHRLIRLSRLNQVFFLSFSLLFSLFFLLSRHNPIFFSLNRQSPSKKWK